MSDLKVSLLFKKYLENQCSDIEVQLLFQFIGGGEYDEVIKQEIDKAEWEGLEMSRERKSTSFKGIFDRILKSKNKINGVNS